MGNDTFLGSDRELETEVYSEPAELIVCRVIFALLVSVSLVLNLLLLMAVVRRRQTVHVIYLLATAMIAPDLGERKKQCLHPNYKQLLNSSS